MKCVLVLKAYKIVNEIIIFKMTYLPIANKRSIKNVDFKDPLVYHYVG